MRPTSSRLEQLYRGLEALYQTSTGINPHDLLVPYRAEASAPREVLLLRETDDGELEVGLALDEDSLHRLESSSADDALSDASLANTLPVLEGLSHLMYVAEAARQERPISGLELETQAEVDKLAFCVLHRWPPSRTEFEQLVDRLYYRFDLEPLDDDLRERYETANRLALAFSRRLQPHVMGGELVELRQTLRRFWHAPMGTKHALAAS